MPFIRAGEIPAEIRDQIADAALAAERMCRAGEAVTFHVDDENGLEIRRISAEGVVRMMQGRDLLAELGLI